MKIGIMGSSHSYGHNHYGTEQETENFVTTLNRYMPNYEFINTAISATGSERFFECLVYLKEHHNVKYILIESVEDRRHKLLRNPNLKFNKDDFELWIKARNYIYTNNVDCEKFDNIFNGIPKSVTTRWLQVNTVLSNMYHRFSVEQGIVNIECVEKICKYANIVPVWWSYQSFPGRKSSHETIKSAYDYFEKHKDWPKKIFIGPDGGHLTQECQDILVRDYINPMIEKAVQEFNYE